MLLSVTSVGFAFMGRGLTPVVADADGSSQLCAYHDVRRAEEACDAYLVCLIARAAKFAQTGDSSFEREAATTVICSSYFDLASCAPRPSASRFFSAGRADD
jgi:hypothetical protein